MKILFFLFFFTATAVVIAGQSASAKSHQKVILAKKKASVSPLETTVFITPSIFYRIVPSASRRDRHFVGVVTVRTINTALAVKGSKRDGKEIHYPASVIS